jgi:hypothetical protein
MKMKLKLILSMMSLLTLFITSCQKDIDAFIPDPGQLSSADTNWVSSISSSMPVSILKKELLLNTYTDSFEVAGLAPTAVTPSGMQCYFTSNSCVNSNGQPVTGKVQAEMMLLKKKGDLIRMDKPTQSHGRMLVTGGVVYLKLKKDGAPVSLAPNASVYIKYAEASPSASMKYFLGDASNTDQFNWLPVTDSFNRVFANNLDYTIITRNLNWINCDYFQDTTGQQSIISSVLPNNYTNANTEVFLVFKDIRSVLGMYGSASTKKFSSYKIPNGKAAYVVVISKQGNDYFFGTESLVTGAQAVGGTSAPEHKVAVSPKKSSLTEIKAWLDTL